MRPRLGRDNDDGACKKVGDGLAPRRVDDECKFSDERQYEKPGLLDCSANSKRKSDNNDTDQRPGNCLYASHLAIASHGYDGNTCDIAAEAEVRCK